MDRRGFLARLTAAATAMGAAAQSGGIVVAAPQEALPAVAPVRRRRLSDAQQQVIDILRECRVMCVGRTDCLDGPPRYTITYRQRVSTGLDDGDKPLPFCNLSHHQILDVGSPLSITANYIGSMADVSHLGQPWAACYL